MTHFAVVGKVCRLPLWVVYQLASSSFRYKSNNKHIQKSSQHFKHFAECIWLMMIGNNKSTKSEREKATSTCTTKRAVFDSKQFFLFLLNRCVCYIFSIFSSSFSIQFAPIAPRVLLHTSRPYFFMSIQNLGCSMLQIASNGSTNWQTLMC